MRLVGSHRRFNKSAQGVISSLVRGMPSNAETCAQGARNTLPITVVRFEPLSPVLEEELGLGLLGLGAFCNVLGGLGVERLTPERTNQYPRGRA